MKKRPNPWLVSLVTSIPIATVMWTVWHFAPDLYIILMVWFVVHAFAKVWRALDNV